YLEVAQLTMVQNSWLPIYLTICIIGLVPTFIFYTKDRKQFALPLSFLLFGIGLIILPQKSSLFNVDWLSEIYTVMMPVTLIISCIYFLKGIALILSVKKDYPFLRPLWFIPAIVGIFLTNS